MEEKGHSRSRVSAVTAALLLIVGLLGAVLLAGEAQRVPLRLALAAASVGGLGLLIAWWRAHRVQLAAGEERKTRLALEEELERKRSEAEAALELARQEQEGHRAEQARRVEIQRWAEAMRNQVHMLASDRGPFGSTDGISGMVLKITMNSLEAGKGLLLSRRDRDHDGDLDLLAYEGFENDPSDSHLAQHFARSVIDKDKTVREGSIELPPDATPADREVDNLVAIPIYLKNEFYGVVVCANKPGGFEEHEDDVLLAIGDQAGAVLDSTRLRGDLRSSYLATIRILSDAIEAKDPLLRGHSDEVSMYVSAVAERLELDAKVREELVFGSLLHDLGKIGISERILLKPSRLTPEEFNIIKLHPRLGYRLVQQVPHLDQICRGVLHHHERWDGKGYPSGLKGEEIPLEARVICIADSFSAMTSERPYSRRKTLAEALEELERCAGTQFDPHLVRLFVEEIRRRPPTSQEQNRLQDALFDPELEERLGEHEPLLGYGTHTIIDHLTMLYSHRYFHEIVSSEVERAELQGSTCAVLFASVRDIDRTNATDGYAAGDAAIRAVGRALQRVAVNCGGTPCRYGGPTLALVIPDADEPTARRCAAELVADLPDGPHLEVAVAVKRDGERSRDLIKRAREEL